MGIRQCEPSPVERAVHRGRRPSKLSRRGPCRPEWTGDVPGHAPAGRRACRNPAARSCDDPSTHASAGLVQVVPARPQTGEPVSLVSISTDTASPITGVAWALTSNGPFQGGGALLTTSFSSPGGHVVRLRVTNANGLSSDASETINVVGPTARLMQPFQSCG